MQDEYTPTNPEPIEAVGAQLESLRKDPSQRDLYVELRETLKKRGLTQRLAEAAEIRAPHEPEPQQAADVWTEAGECRLLLGQAELGERALRQAIALSPAHERATSLL